MISNLRSKIEIVNELSVSEFIALRQMVNFQSLQEEQAKLILEKTTYIAAARYEGKCIGITRLIYDYGTDAYITDVIVNPEYQGLGIGKMLVEDVLNFIRKNSFSNVKVACSLYANKGKELFYKKLGFEDLPNDKYGHGMLLEIGDGTAENLCYMRSDETPIN